VPCLRATWADDVVQQALLIGVYAFLVPEATKIAVVYYSATGNVHGLAQAVAAGAEEAGAEVRLRHVEELASELLISQNQYWGRHRSDVAQRTIPFGRESGSTLSRRIGPRTDCEHSRHRRIRNLLINGRPQ